MHNFLTANKQIISCKIYGAYFDGMNTVECTFWFQMKKNNYGGEKE